MTLQPIAELLPAVVAQLSHHNPGRTPPMTANEAIELLNEMEGGPGEAVCRVLDEVERLRAALVTESGHVDRLVTANKAAADEVERLRKVNAQCVAALKLAETYIVADGK